MTSPRPYFRPATLTPVRRLRFKRRRPFGKKSDEASRRSAAGRREGEVQTQSAEAGDWQRGDAERGGGGLLSGHATTHPACAERLPPGPRGLQTAASPSDLSAFGSCALADLPPGHGSAFLPRVLLPRHVTRTTPSANSLHLRAGSELEALRNKKNKTPEDLRSQRKRRAVSDI